MTAVWDLWLPRVWPAVQHTLLPVRAGVIVNERYGDVTPIIASSFRIALQNTAQSQNLPSPIQVKIDLYGNGCFYRLSISCGWFKSPLLDSVNDRLVHIWSNCLCNFYIGRNAIRRHGYRN